MDPITIVDYDPARAEELTLGDQRVRFDRVATQAQYAEILQPWSMQCSCDECRNFAAQKELAYPPVFMRLLEKLGIDSRKEGEAYNLGTQPDGRQLYGGWFHFCGELIERGKNRVTHDGIEYWIAGPGDMPAPGAPFGGKPLALEFQTSVPWVLTDVRPEW